MLVLGIETSCDETSVALVEDGCRVLGVRTFSQVKSHEKYGGVVPEIASRIHVNVLHYLLEDLFQEIKIKPDDIGLLAVANRPGLIGSLLVGISFANGLAFCWNKPVVGIHHLEAHIYGAFMEEGKQPQYPSVALIVSGGHTQLVQVDALGEYTLLGNTLDDAAGEAFDKVAKILGLSYPGGPVIDKYSQVGDPGAWSFPRALLEDSSLAFSFSGLKTAVLYAVKGYGRKISQTSSTIPERMVKDIAASFQRAVVDVLVIKMERALEKTRARSMIVCGGVAANSELKSAMHAVSNRKNVPLFLPPLFLCTDNALMVAGLGWHKRHQATSFILETYSNSPINK
ncbi:MAG: tRNA (adenosine(37)-N6)-threonylcarbamoyltransferase complex transferase subunit TsaD [Candidatus Aureabacteria bacterium]|nr:tRNA (adenosine(37)-N6)-threonylcarbamoyltransferase complex transferase subunit TsaD [Candidatus Auribacterota bacterium]